MRLRERTEIDRPAAHVWRYVITPELFLRWNDKVVDMDAQGEFQLGRRFSTLYEMNRKQLQCSSQIAELDAGRLLELHHGSFSGQGIRSDMEVIERVTLEEKGGRTVVTKEVTIRNSGVPWILAPLFWFISRFGRPVGRDKLKELCEGGG